MLLADLELSRRLESAEGLVCVQQAVARRRLQPDSAAVSIELGGVSVVFDGPDSPCTQTFGLGLFQPPTPELLDSIESFFLERGAPVLHEVSPFAGVETFALLCTRGYQPIELSNVLYQPVRQPAPFAPPDINVRIVGPGEADLWSEIHTHGWSHDHPEFAHLLFELGIITAAREHTVCFLAEFNGIPGAAGALCLHGGVALFAGSATVPELRRRGLQAALLHHRMRFALDHQCDLAMMAALPGSNSQRNAQRAGFHIAYTRTKWQLARQ